FRDERISRRTWLRGAGATAAVVGAIALAGCGDSSSKPEAAAPSPSDSKPDQPDILNPSYPPRRGGRLVTANSASFGSFDPHVGIAVASAYFPRVYNALLSQSPTKPEFMYFDLAESLETADPTTYI